MSRGKQTSKKKTTAKKTKKTTKGRYQKRKLRRLQSKQQYQYYSNIQNRVVKRYVYPIRLRGLE